MPVPTERGHRKPANCIMTTAPDSPISDPDKARVYRADSRFGIGMLAAARALAGEFVAYRSHINTIFMDRFRASYRGAALGVFWNFILPVVPITVYVFLAYLRVFPTRDGIAPALFIGFNVTIWYLLTGLIREPMSVVKSRNALAMKTALPLSASIASSFAQIIFETVVRIGLVIGLIFWFQQWPALAAPLAVLSLLPAMAFCLGLGFCLAIFNAVYPDVERVTTIALQYGIFVSGVIFPLSSISALSFLEWANPFQVYIKTARDLVFMGTMDGGLAYGIWGGLGVLLLFIGIRFFYVMEYRLRTLV